ncbi:uncharacterized protein OCT59_016431 [Rhizophagus irregularis]|uniref:Uncharacterized protein n=2 Tax=Rhizophagus irregularis TaxID=588596 RepID=A0A015LHP9_RHIIW|nr:hypothetical protein GLOIN_2v1764160 [Rhizophagus irregularis DAOM 181602=DAOM 197198]EXX54398.1 hypothetical protein RirG_234890 [Rhizophagus irregularis DAOM 197198w]POG80606.1 hypothetical protein GLOIN_2v1764160 [Rhizophagus irregularis DAOM 181602=DAOM 197198]UZO24113.1 hypothetical protein OCT59_016431 [Rhizophagus irregularis]GBC31502.2 hypothetical protein GLOIN_2v1764160 [Rhizophagus irregularis DAOM 181602=DAOM 197198]|eukprot:XP_025187472.1 hypothetical protein GLOIN_2v1764160 [Rhizophagus irregularis DAOM 181602=DAOM 197198]
MEEDIGRGLQMKDQDELIGKGGVFKKRTGFTKFSVPIHTTSKDKFVNALSGSLSTIPRSKEEHEELDDLNNKFSERLDKIEKKKEEITTEEIVTTVEEDKVNENKKRVVTT